MDNSTKTPNNPLLLGVFIARKINKRRKRQFYFLTISIIFGGILEMFSLSSIIPLLVIISDSSKIWEIPYISNIFRILGIYESDHILLATTILFIMGAIISTSVRIFSVWISSKMAALVGNDFSYQIFKNILNQEYEYHTNTNSSKLLSIITTKLNYLVVVINLLLQMIASTILSCALLLFLLIYKPLIAMTVYAICVIAYISISIIAKKRLDLNGIEIEKYGPVQIRIVQELLGGIRDIIMIGRPVIYQEGYKKADKILRLRAANNSIIAGTPKYIIELIGLTLISILAYAFTKQGETGLVIIPTLGTLAIASQRLLPSFQIIYTSWSRIRSYTPSIHEVMELFELKTNIRDDSNRNKRIEMKNSIVFKNVYFKYKGSEKFILKDVSFEIKKGECIGIKGETGAGKSTIIDLIIGLLKPTKGRILVDDIDINKDKESNILNSWRSSISIVSQKLFLIDNSIKNNIAIGLYKKEIDIDKIKKAAKTAHIDKFIESSPDGYETIVGEQGVKLSGGQIQRIGIARALYRQCNILVFDEATSALDAITESLVMDSLNSIKNLSTMIMISHKENTLEFCDRVLKIEDGRIKSINSK